MGPASWPNRTRASRGRNGPSQPMLTGRNRTATAHDSGTHYEHHGRHRPRHPRHRCTRRTTHGRPLQRRRNDPIPRTHLCRFPFGNLQSAPRGPSPTDAAGDHENSRSRREVSGRSPALVLHERHNPTHRTASPAAQHRRHRLASRRRTEARPSPRPREADPVHQVGALRALRPCAGRPMARCVPAPARRHRVAVTPRR